MTFDKVPHNSNFLGLDYNATTQEPARGVVVEAVDAGGVRLASDVTDANGAYDLTVSPNTDVRVQVRSELQQSGSSSWDISVVDNTSSNAIYVLSGSLADSGTTNSQRNLNAGSGWGGSSYTGTRAAAPFSILDAIYTTITKIEAVDPNVNFPTLQVFWSVNNVPTDGDVTQGEIGTSSYTRTNNVPTIRILGDAGNDTDEYDIHVVVHEFGHYFEDQLSRSDSPGGSHSLSDRLDPRLAFGEGWGNAFAGMILDDPVYRDSLNAQQASGFAFNVESDLTPGTGGSRQPGWYNEASVQQLLYDIYDSNDDGADSISGGLAPLYNAFTDTTYVQNTDFTTIFAFADRVRNEAAVDATMLDAMLAAEDINGTGSRGVGETNSGTLADALPVYKTISQGGSAVTVCSNPVNGDTNKLGVRDFVTFTLASTGAVTFTADTTVGPAVATDPDFFIWEAGQLFTRDSRGQDRRAQSSDNCTETWTGTLDAGTYAIEVFDFNNFDSATEARSCFSFSVN